MKKAITRNLIVTALGLFVLGGQITVSAEETGEALYKTYCSQCHGIKGDGMGVNVRDMAVQPRDHTDRVAMSSRSDADLFKVVKEGGQAISKSVLMPAWAGAISDDEINSLVKHMRVLCQCQHGSGS
ncbi:MAG: cytochrome c [Gammaproteobacteria bacterium]|nr:cytochrome c [Gammaproteobacteria bacterium]